MLEFLKNIFIGTDKQYIETRIPQLISGKRFELSSAEKISTVYNCIDIRSKTLAKLPLEKFKETPNGKEKDKTDSLYKLIHYSPNAYTTSYNFITALEANLCFTGNAFALINRNQASGKPESLNLLVNQVHGYYIEGGSVFYFVQIDKTKDEYKVIPGINMLHFKMLTRDGVWGMNPIEALRMNLSTTYKGMQTIDTFYDNNATSPKALKSTISGANQKAMLEALELFNEKYTGASNAGQMVPLPPNTEIQELKLNFADAQFIETVKFNANQIAALFGIPPHMVGNTESSKYNNVEQMEIGFRADTISPLARMYRQELEFKLLTTKQQEAGDTIEFNLNAMIETDAKTRFESYKVLSSIGAISPNKIAQIENLPTDPSGDVRIIPMNMMGLDKLNKQANKDNNQKNDNNV